MDNFKGSLKEIIIAMINGGTDCCEVTNTVGDFSVTLNITITKIVNAGEILYDAEAKLKEFQE